MKQSRSINIHPDGTVRVSFCRNIILRRRISRFERTSPQRSKVSRKFVSRETREKRIPELRTRREKKEIKEKLRQIEYEAPSQQYTTSNDHDLPTNFVSNCPHKYITVWKIISESRRQTSTRQRIHLATRKDERLLVFLFFFPSFFRTLL